MQVQKRQWKQNKTKNKQTNKTKQKKKTVEGKKAHEAMNREKEPAIKL